MKNEESNPIKTCNVPPIDSSDSVESVESVRLVPYLQQHYASALLDSVCLVKVDTEGHDTAILRDLLRSPAFRPPIIWTEWFELFKYIDIPGNMTRMLEVYLLT